MACGLLPRPRRNTCSSMTTKACSINGDACFLARRVNNGRGLQRLVIPRCTDSISDVRKVLNLAALSTAAEFHPQNQLSQSTLSLEPPDILATLFRQPCDLDQLLFAMVSPSVKWTELCPGAACLLQRRNEIMYAKESVLVSGTQGICAAGRSLPFQLLFCVSQTAHP